jgi:hypothetical protein
VYGQGHLLEIVGAFQAVGRLAHLLHGRQQQADQNADDRNNDQKFDEREAPTPCLSVDHVSLDRRSRLETSESDWVGDGRVNSIITLAKATVKHCLCGRCEHRERSSRGLFLFSADVLGFKFLRDPRSRVWTHIATAEIRSIWTDKTSWLLFSPG